MAWTSIDVQPMYLRSILPLIMLMFRISGIKTSRQKRQSDYKPSNQVLHTMVLEDHECSQGNIVSSLSKCDHLLNSLATSVLLNTDLSNYTHVCSRFSAYIGCAWSQTELCQPVHGVFRYQYQIYTWVYTRTPYNCTNTWPQVPSAAVTSYLSCYHLTFCILMQYFMFVYLDALS